MGDRIQNSPLWDMPRENSADVDVSNVYRYSQTFSSTGTTAFIVPVGVSTIRTKIWGAGGGGGRGDNSNAGADGVAGAYLESDLSVTPGESLSMVVGAGGDQGDDATGGTGSDGGGTGGNGTAGQAAGGQGGGLTCVKRSSTILACAGSGAGGTGSNGDVPEASAGSFNSAATGGTSGFINAGGRAGTAGGNAGSSETGGNGVVTSGAAGGGGGGGDGYYGGGTGAAGDGAGSGSSYPIDGATFVKMYLPGNSNTAVNTSDEDYVSGHSVGGDGATANANDATAGGDGLIVVFWN